MGDGTGLLDLLVGLVVAGSAGSGRTTINT